MAQYGYYPQYFNAAQYQPQAAPQQAAPGIVWVQGEAGAKSYLVGAGQSVLLLDSESDTFFLKSADQSGMPMIRKFRYTEEQVGKTNAPAVMSVGAKNSEYISRDEFNKYREEIDAKISHFSKDERE